MTFIQSYIANHVSKVEMARARGLALGLSAEETDEVMTAWVEYHKTVPDPVDYGVIMTALDRRASGLSWRPMGETRLWVNRHDHEAMVKTKVSEGMGEDEARYWASQTMAIYPPISS